jgi:predicted ATPase
MLTITERLFRCRLARNDATIIGDLTRLCLDHPVRESLWAVLIRAHCQAGNQADALRAATRLRVNLRDELGVVLSDELRQLEQQILDHDPELRRSHPLRTPPTERIGNRPAERTPLIGRDRDLTTVCELLDRHRLVTLTGVGGIGKTRLALDAARMSSRGYDDGAWLIKLAETGDDDDVVINILSTLGIRTRAGLTTADVLIDTLAAQRTLLLIDNCEHVSAGVSTIVERLLDETAGITVLATSREGLGITGEHLVAVPSLDTDGSTSPAVELFTGRARDAGWNEHDGDSDLISALCRQLDGVPLAIELAAARARAMPIAAIVERLDDRFRLLTGRRRSIELGAAEQVCSGDDLEPRDIDELIGALVDKSMVNIDGTTYELLETLRQFGEQRLATTDDPTRYHNAHLTNYVDFVIEAHDGLQSAEEAAWWRRQKRSWPNIRPAFEWAIERHSIDSAMALVAYTGFGAGEHLQEEPAHWAEQVIELPGADRHRLFPTCLGHASLGAVARGELPRDLELAERAVDAQRDPRDDLDYSPMWSLVTCHQIRNHTEQTLEPYLDLSDRAGRAGHLFHHAQFLCGAAFALQFAGKNDESLPIAPEARRVAERVGSPSAQSFSMIVEGWARINSEPTKAVELLDHAREIASNADAGLHRFQCDTFRAVARLRSGDARGSITITRENSKALRRRGLWGWWGAVAIHGIVALERLDDVELACLMTPLISGSPYAQLFHQRLALDRLERRLSERLEPGRHRELTEEGAGLTFARAADLLEQAATRHVCRGRAEVV